MSDYRKQAADVQLHEAERIASRPDVVQTLHDAGADVHALVASAEHAVGQALRGSTERTTHLDSTRRSMPGHVPVHRTFGRGTEADTYELLDGAPVGRPDTLQAARARYHADVVAAAWDAHNARADSGLALTRAQRRNKRTAARRAAKQGT